MGSRSIVGILLLEDFVIVGTQDGIVKIFHVSRMIVKKTIYPQHELIAVGITEKEEKPRKNKKITFGKTVKNQNNYGVANGNQHSNGHHPQNDDNDDDEDEDDDEDDDYDEFAALKTKLLFCFQRHRPEAPLCVGETYSAPGVVSVYDLETCELVQEMHLLGFEVEDRHPFAVSQVQMREAEKRRAILI